MAVPLTPKAAALLCKSAYDTRLDSDMRTAARTASEAGAAFSVADGRRFTGVSGLSVPSGSSSTGFGYVAFGSGSRQGECLISVRGTELTSHHDWLTNVHVSGIRGPSGYTVHEGFNNVAASIVRQVREALRNRNPSAIHLVGHSLGGATATILADHLQRTAEIKLYTFGAPRAGSLAHSRYLTSALGTASIFRVYHDTDVVPMLPIFPFAHAPTTTNQYLLAGCGAVVSVAAHGVDMYAQTVGEGSWRSLDTLGQRRVSFDTVDDILEVASSVGTGSSMLSARVLRLIGLALALMLGDFVRRAGTSLFVSATVLDQMAAALAWGAAQSMATARATVALIGMIMRFTGRVIDAATNITVSFIRWVLQMLFAFISTNARRAVMIAAS